MWQIQNNDITWGPHPQKTSCRQTQEICCSPEYQSEHTVEYLHFSMPLAYFLSQCSLFFTFLTQMDEWMDQWIDRIFYWSPNESSRLTKDSEYNSVDENVIWFLSLGYETVAFIDTSIGFADLLQHQGTVSFTQPIQWNIHTTPVFISLVRVHSCSLKHRLNVSLPFNMFCLAGQRTQFTRQDSCASHLGRYSDLRVCRGDVCEANQSNTWRYEF